MYCKSDVCQPLALCHSPSLPLFLPSFLPSLLAFCQSLFLSFFRSFSFLFFLTCPSLSFLFLPFPSFSVLFLFLFLFLSLFLSLLFLFLCLCLCLCLSLSLSLFASWQQCQCLLLTSSVSPLSIATSAVFCLSSPRRSTQSCCTLDVSSRGHTSKISTGRVQNGVLYMGPVLMTSYDVLCSKIGLYLYTVQ